MELYNKYGIEYLIVAPECIEVIIHPIVEVIVMYSN